MDDKRFDEIIKQKAEGYVDTGHDAQALTDFRKRMSDLPKKNSGWSAGNTAYLVGSMLLFSMLNFGIMWYFSEGRYQALNSEIEQLKGEKAHLTGLGEKLRELRGLATREVDTVYIYRELPAVNTSDNTPDPGQQLQGLATYPQESAYQGVPNTFGTGIYYALLESDQQLSEELEDFLSSHNLLLKGDQGEMVLVLRSDPVVKVNDFNPNKDQYHTASSSPQFLPEVATYEQPEKFRKPDKKKIPNKVLWALEKHNHRGVDFQVGVEGQYYKSNYEVGSGEPNSGFGVLTELIFNPSLRLETGINISARSYRVGDQEIQSLPPDFFNRYPSYNEDGNLFALESEAKLVKFPINLKWFNILDHNKRWYISAGVTPQIATSQEFDFKYVLDLPEPPIGGGTEYVSFVGAATEVPSSYYNTMVNLGVGTEVYLNEKLRWQIGLFYQKGLGEAGAEKIKLNNSFGVKTSLWFNPPPKK